MRSMRNMRSAAGGIASCGSEVTLVEAYDSMRRHTEIGGEGIQKALEFELIALESGADPSWGRAQLVRPQKRLAGHKGGLATLFRYGRSYYRALARVRWGKTQRAARPAIRDALAGPGGSEKGLRPHEAASEHREEIAA